MRQMRLLEQRRLQQQGELLQQQLSAPAPIASGPLGLAALTSKFPLSSALLGSFNNGSPGAAATASASVTPPPSSMQVSDAILRELQLNLIQGGSTVGADSLHRAINRLMGGGANAGILDASRLLAASAGAPSASSLASLNRNAPSSPTTREDLLRQLMTANSGSGATCVPPALSNDLGSMLTQNLQQQQMLSSPASSARKRDSAHLQGVAAAAPENEGRRCLTKKLRRSPAPLPAEEPSGGKEELALTAAAAELNERAEAARMIASLAYPPSNNKRKFPLPSEKGDGVAPTAPKMNAFHQAWGNVKSKTMRKEIFLRKLHAGTLFKGCSRRSSSSAPSSSGSKKNTSDSKALSATANKCTAPGMVIAAESM